MPEEPKEHRKLAAIMFTDMVGYSALTQKNEKLALELLDEHRKLLRPILSKHGGREIETAGDSFFVEFGSALEATQCAIEIQKTLFKRNKSSPPERAITIRIGLHLGDVVYMDKHVHGDGVNIAARIEPLAEPGGISISEDMARQVQNKIELPVIRLGNSELKNIQLQMDIYQIVMPWGKKHFVLLPTKSISSDKNSVAVLPFENLSDSKDDEYFSYGVTEDIIAQLSKIRKLKVISATSVMLYRNSDIKTIAGKLNISYLLRGTIRRAGNKVRIVAKLIDSQTEEHRWLETYNKELTDIFATQSEVAESIATALAITISPEEKERLEKKSTGNLEAYDLYLKGRYSWNERTREGLNKSIVCYRQAIERDPLFALAHAGLADSYNILGSFNHLAPKEAFPIAKAEALKALELDSTLAEAQAALGWIILNYDWNWHLAEEHFKRAIELNPSYATAHQWYSHVLILTGRLEEGLTEIEQAEKLDPFSPIIRTDKGLKLYYARRYDEAIEQYRKTLVSFPGFFQAHYCYGLALLQRSMYKDAVASLIKARNLSGFHPGTVAILGYAYARSGNQRAASEILDELARKSKQVYISPYFFAIIYTGLGQKDRAIEWLDAALEDRSNWMIYLGVQPIFDSLRSDPRFGALLKKLDLTSET
ncbi:MAG: tetratricopeptide repeat protein [Ignavibacteriae bacterium]|nr:tetratricopeptide repeat protein [Ignavibacteriota bacterium]